MLARLNHFRHIHVGILGNYFNIHVPVVFVLNTNLGFLTQTDMMGGLNETFVNEVHVIPLLIQPSFNISYSAVVTTTTVGEIKKM